MKKSINLYCNTILTTKEKIQAIKQAGYDEFFTGFNTHNEDLNHIDQIKFAKSVGLNCTMIHCKYDNSILHDFWDIGKNGHKIFLDFKKQIKSCKNLTKNFAIHLNSYHPFQGSIIGLKRIIKLLKICEKLNINLCVENLNTEDCIRFIFANLSHPKLKICYDIGHKNVRTPSFDIAKEYGPLIEVLHIHQNNGVIDEHKPLTLNSKVYKMLKNDLNYLKDNIVLSCELKFLNDNFDQRLKSNLNVLNTLQKNEP